jgi:hypothetical protein
MKIVAVGPKTLTVFYIRLHPPPEAVVDGMVPCCYKRMGPPASEDSLPNDTEPTEFPYHYEICGLSAPWEINMKDIKDADFVLVFRDGKSLETELVIESCEKLDILMRVVEC